MLTDGVFFLFKLSSLSISHHPTLPFSQSCCCPPELHTPAHPQGGPHSIPGLRSQHTSAVQQGLLGACLLLLPGPHQHQPDILNVLLPSTSQYFLKTGVPPDAMRTNAGHDQDGAFGIIRCWFSKYPRTSEV